MTPELAGTNNAWVAEKYGSEKAVAFWRSALMVIAAAPASHFFAAKAAPEVICWNSMSTMSWVTPSFFAARSMRSTSKPTTLPLSSLYSNGLYDRLVQTVSLPAATRVGAGALEPATLLAAVVELE